MDYCGNCGCSFGGTEQKPLRTRIERVKTYEPDSSFEDRGRISLLLYLGASLVAISGLLYALAAAASTDNRLPPGYTAYATAILLAGIAFALVGFARQAKRMVE
jgi:hypothetical protein